MQYFMDYKWKGHLAIKIFDDDSDGEKKKLSNGAFFNKGFLIFKVCEKCSPLTLINVMNNNNNNNNVSACTVKQMYHGGMIGEKVLLP